MKQSWETSHFQASGAWNEATKNVSFLLWNKASLYTCSFPLNCRFLMQSYLQQDTPTFPWSFSFPHSSPSLSRLLSDPALLTGGPRRPANLKTRVKKVLTTAQNRQRQQARHSPRVASCKVSPLWGRASIVPRPAVTGTQLTHKNISHTTTQLYISKEGFNCKSSQFCKTIWAISQSLRWCRVHIISVSVGRRTHQALILPPLACLPGVERGGLYGKDRGKEGGKERKKGGRGGRDRCEPRATKLGKRLDLRR